MLFFEHKHEHAHRAKKFVLILLMHTDFYIFLHLFGSVDIANALRV